MKVEFDAKQPLIQNEARTALLCFNEETIQKPAGEGSEETVAKYAYDCARTPIGADYPAIVTAIIRSRYTADEVEAIVLNHGDGNPDHEAEYTALQQWRTEAKRVAKEVLARN